MKKKLITLLMIVTLLAGMTTIFASATTQLWELDDVDLGDFNWDGLGGSADGNQLGWHTTASAANDNAESNGLTVGQLVKATHLVLEVSEAPAGDLAIFWQSDIDSWNWNQSSVPLEDLELMYDGGVIKIPLPYYIKDYAVFFSIGVKEEGFIDANFGALLEDDDIDLIAKIGLGYYEASLLDWIVSAKLTYDTPGRPANDKITYDLMPHLTPGVTTDFAFSTQYAQAAGDGTPGVTLIKSIVGGARGMTIVVDKELEADTVITLILQSMDAWWQANEMLYDYYWDADAGEGYIDFWFSLHPDWDYFAEYESNLHAKFGIGYFDDDAIGALGITGAYLWWAEQVRGEVEPPPVIEDTPEPSVVEDTPEPPAPAVDSTPTPEAPADSDGLGVWLWVLIGGGAVVVVVVIILIVKGKKG